MTNSLSTREIPVFRTSPFRPMQDIVNDVGRAFERSGDVLQVKGFPARVYCLKNPTHIEELFYNPDSGGIKLPWILPRVKYVMRSGAYILPGGAEWRERRIQVQKGYKGEYLDRYLEHLPPMVERMLQEWESAMTRDGRVDVMPGLQALITQASLKQYFSIDLSPEDLTAVRQQTHFIELNFVRPWPLWLPFPDHFRFRRCTRALRSRFLSWVRIRREHPVPAHDAMTLLLAAEHKATGIKWTDDEIVDEMFSIYFGAMVMATTLAWALTLLGQNREALHKLRAEAQTVFDGRTPRGSDLEHLPYSDLVVKETLRLYPPSWGFPRHTRAPFRFDGYEIPPDSLVIPMIYHVHRDPVLWGDWSAYRPERFADDQHAQRPALAFFPFGSGQRTCLGINLAPWVLRLVLAQLAAKLDFELAPRFAGDPLADFGFEIHPKDSVFLARPPR